MARCTYIIGRARFRCFVGLIIISNVGVVERIFAIGGKSASFVKHGGIAMRLVPSCSSRFRFPVAFLTSFAFTVPAAFFLSPPLFFHFGKLARRFWRSTTFCLREAPNDAAERLVESVRDLRSLRPAMGRLGGGINLATLGPASALASPLPLLSASSFSLCDE